MVAAKCGLTKLVAAKLWRRGAGQGATDKTEAGAKRWRFGSGHRAAVETVAEGQWIGPKKTPSWSSASCGPELPAALLMGAWPLGWTGIAAGALGATSWRGSHCLLGQERSCCG